jgi:transposase-like protein
MPGGRPSKFSVEKQETICKAIATGSTYAEAAAAAGIDYTTLLAWRRRGEKANSGKLFEFSKAIKKAEDQSEAELLSRIVNAGRDPKYWQANAWILERRMPDRWGRKDRMEMTGKDGTPIEITVKRID